jgi:hypothetical protein
MSNHDGSGFVVIALIVIALLILCPQILLIIVAICVGGWFLSLIFGDAPTTGWRY